MPIPGTWSGDWRSGISSTLALLTMKLNSDAAALIALAPLKISFIRDDIDTARLRRRFPGSILP